MVLLLQPMAVQSDLMAPLPSLLLWAPRMLLCHCQPSPVAGQLCSLLPPLPMLPPLLHPPQAAAQQGTEEPPDWAMARPACARQPPERAAQLQGWQTESMS